ncbi:ribonuclease HII [Winogradskyella sp. A3E31]|uniref:ribonuclease HII n=1 Tax=Winogradskyella sp. A3E31 TaxID=3349637 RepID=UPI00398A7F94
MRQYILCALIFTSIFSCQKNNSSKFTASDFILEEDLIIKVNAFNDFLTVAETDDAFSKFNNSSAKSLTKLLSHFKPKEEFLITFTEDSITPIYSFITKQDSTLLVLDSVSNVLSITLGKTGIKKTIIDTDTLYHTIKNGYFYGSNSQQKVETIEPTTSSNALKSLLKTTHSEKTASFVFKNTAKVASNFYLNHLGNDDTKITNYTALDFEFDNNSMRYNGITEADSSFVLNVFNESNPQPLQTAKIAPSDSKGFVSVSFDDFKRFDLQLKKRLKKPIDSSATFLDYSNEIGLIETPQGDVIAVHALDVELIAEIITLQTFSETYRDFDIYTFNQKDTFQSRFEPFISLDEVNYIVKVDDFLLFSQNSDVLKEIISDHLNNKTLSTSEQFKDMYTYLSDASSLFIYKNGKALSDALGKDFSDYDTNAVQLVYDNDFAHINGVVKKYTKRRPTNSVTEEFNVSLPNTILLPPQTVKNHITKGSDIVVQDINNILYQISSSGKTLWKKQLHGPVLGNIEQIDMYKNGRLQLAFATPNRVYVLDRNGNDVAPFPLKFNDKITQPLSVFDYDNNRNYRLLVTQDKELLMYSAKGESVNGFDYSKTGTITSQPKHFRIGRKDYIVFSAKNKLKVLSRQGDIRVNVSETIDFSDNEIFLYEDRFTTTNNSGSLVQVDTRGRVTKENLSLQPNHKIYTTSKTLTSFSDSRLSIKSRTVDLDFGDYTAPKIFYLNDKIYITITDKQTKQVYLYDSQAKAIPNFPVYGVESAILEKLDTSRGLELITQSDDKSIIVYKLN